MSPPCSEDCSRRSSGCSSGPPRLPQLLGALEPRHSSVLVEVSLQELHRLSDQRPLSHGHRRSFSRSSISKGPVSLRSVGRARHVAQPTGSAQVPWQHIWPGGACGLRSAQLALSAHHCARPRTPPRARHRAAWMRTGNTNPSMRIVRLFHSEFLERSAGLPV